jgi:uncharacterized protein
MGESESAAPHPSTYGPVPRGERLVNIDFVRGVALLGILLVNASSFFAPMIAEARPSAVAALPPHDRAARLLITALCNTKFISLFAMLFGYGLLTQIERVSAAGHSAWWFSARRLVTLGVIGLAHGLGLWYGDVLFTYATLGLVIVIFRPVKQPRDLIILAVVFLAYFALMRMLGEFLTLYLDGMSLPDRRGTRGLQAIVASGFNPSSPTWAEAETEASARGPYRDLFAFRAVIWTFSQLEMAFFAWCLIAGLFVLGMWLYRVRFFAPEQLALRRKVFLICLPIGLAVEGLGALCCIAGLKGPPVLWAVGGAIQALSLPVLPLGYLAGMSLLADALPRWLTSPIVAAGRMPLTVYLSETVISTTLAYYYGFGWFGTVGPAEQALIAVCVWAALVAFSRAWLAVFRLGPMEWLWRLAEYGRTRAG